MNIDQLISQANELLEIDYSSPKIELWEKRTKKFTMKNYGEEYIEILENALSWGQIFSPGQGPSLHRKAIN